MKKPVQDIWSLSMTKSTYTLAQPKNVFQGSFLCLILAESELCMVRPVWFNHALFTDYDLRLVFARTLRTNESKLKIIHSYNQNMQLSPFDMFYFKFFEN